MALPLPLPHGTPHALFWDRSTLDPVHRPCQLRTRSLHMSRAASLSAIRSFPCTEPPRPTAAGLLKLARDAGLDSKLLLKVVPKVTGKPAEDAQLSIVQYLTLLVNYAFYKAHTPPRPMLDASAHAPPQLRPRVQALSPQTCSSHASTRRTRPSRHIRLCQENPKNLLQPQNKETVPATVLPLG